MRSLNIRQEYPYYTISVSPDSHYGNLIFIGECENLSYGKKYSIRNATIFFSNGICKNIFIVNGDDDSIVEIDLKYFVDESEFRDLKIKEILE